MQTALTIAVLVLIALQLWPRVQPLLARLPVGGVMEWLRANAITLLIAGICGVLAGWSTPPNLRPSLPSWVTISPAGPRKIYIVREQEADDTKFAVLKVQLRNGAFADYLKSKGHTLEICDDDDAPPQFAPYNGNELIVTDAAGMVTFRGPTPMLPSEVMAAIKKGGA